MKETIQQEARTRELEIKIEVLLEALRAEITKRIKTEVELTTIESELYSIAEDAVKSQTTIRLKDTARRIGALVKRITCT